jgi:hypothetical protein
MERRQTEGRLVTRLRPLITICSEKRLRWEPNPWDVSPKSPGTTRTVFSVKNVKILESGICIPCGFRADSRGWARRPHSPRDARMLRKGCGHGMMPWSRNSRKAPMDAARTCTLTHRAIDSRDFQRKRTIVCKL